VELSSESIRHIGERDKKQNKALLDRIKNRPPNHLDSTVHDLHHKAFEKIDCLRCANCCKTTSPLITPTDIDRMAKRLRMKPSEFIETYLNIDEEGDYVFRSAPCPMLDSDNYCKIYNERPTACRTYPHTDRKKFYQLSKITYQNSFICPAVQDILNGLRQKLLGHI
jgi:Fe-S-cluster containining protein